MTMKLEATLKPLPKKYIHKHLTVNCNNNQICGYGWCSLVLSTHTHTHRKKNTHPSQDYRRKPKTACIQIKDKRLHCRKKKSIQIHKKSFSRSFASTEQFRLTTFQHGFFDVKIYSVVLCLKAKSLLSRTKTNNSLDERKKYRSCRQTHSVPHTHFRPKKNNNNDDETKQIVRV